MMRGGSETVYFLSLIKTIKNMIYLAGVESHLKNNKTACFTLIISKNTRGDLLCDE